MPDVDLDDDLTSPSKSSGSDPDDPEIHIINTTKLPQMCTEVQIVNVTNLSSNSSSLAEDDELGDGLRTGPTSLNILQQEQTEVALIPSHTVQLAHSSHLARTSSLPWIPGVERRRRKLPEIPKNKKCKFLI